MLQSRQSLILQEQITVDFLVAGEETRNNIQTISNPIQTETVNNNPIQKQTVHQQTVIQQFITTAEQLNFHVLPRKDPRYPSLRYQPYIPPVD